jgi:hypothetical protein
MVVARTYDIHGLRLTTVADSRISQALAARLGRFPVIEGPDWELKYEVQRSPVHFATPELSEARVVYESAVGQVLYCERADLLHLRCVWPIEAVCDPRAGLTRVSVVGDTEPYVWALAHPLLTLPLLEQLKRRGRYSLHAAAVALGGKTLLFAGSSGSGKTTLALALARAGYAFLGDDMVFLARAGTRLQALAFPEAFDVTDETVALFPELGDLRGTEKLPGASKYQFRVETRFNAQIAWRSDPVALIFPHFTGSLKSMLEPMDASAALLELVPNILLTETSASQQHLDVLSQLVSQCACYRLMTGRDLDALAGQLRKLVEIDS